MYTISKIAEIVGGKVFPGAADDTEVRDILIDSRRLIRPEGTLFVAIVTTRNDGHQYIQELCEKGVRLFLISKDRDECDDEAKHLTQAASGAAQRNRSGGVKMQANTAMQRCGRDHTITITVPDTLIALRKLAAYHRRQFDIPVIGITGSNGKTIVKEWLYQLLSPDFNIIRSPKSYNSQIGVPLSVWKMDTENQLAIFEAGISMPGEMEKLEEIIKPDYGIITNIGHAHDEHFKSKIQKADEKLRLFKHSKIVVYCSDYDLIDSCVKFCDPNRTFTPFSWSRRKPADLEIRDVNKALSKTEITAVFKGEELKFSIPFTDDASVENAIHCFALILCLEEREIEAMHFTQAASGAAQRNCSGGVKMQANDAVRDCERKMRPKIASVIERLASLAPIAMRLELKDAINHCSLINDSYNSDINSLSIALDFLIQQNQHKKKTIILSDILQSGRDKNDLYNEIAALLDSKGISKLIGIGRDINKYSDKFKMQKNFFYTTDDFLMHYPVSSFHDESILLKGARLFEFERISNVLQQKAHETVLEINLDAMVHNLNHYRSLLKPGVKVMAMVKAFSYGSGSFEIANLLQYHRADYLAVAYADEGVELRKSGIRLPIMVMSPEEQSLDTLLKYNLEPEIYNLHILTLLEEAVKRNQTSNQEAVRVHIKLDTGMHRLGFQEDELDELIEKLKINSEVTNQSITVVSVFSHLAASEDASENEFTKSQIQAFDKMSNRIITAIGYPALRHILNSAGINRFPQAQFDMVRLGIGLYGVGANDEEQQKMRNVSSLRTIVIQLKQIKKGETIGYNRKGKAIEDCLIAVIPIGYADGLNRRLGNGAGKVYINGKAAPIIGNVCMDLTMVDVTGIKVNEGDEVVIFGDSHPVTELAEATGTIPYEVMTGISRRVKRIYYNE
ncbi:MAG: alanine racemase [Bacteroidetes bacterium]|nr:alanine racemase [Bacteroidota bacterium]